MSATRYLVLSCLAVALIHLPGSSQAACPAELEILEELSCSTSVSATVDHSRPSYLGGDCDFDLCYGCGIPWDHEDQLGPERVYRVACQSSGIGHLEFAGPKCDLDIYVLDSSCDPATGCLGGATTSDSKDSVQFPCSPGETYYVVIEAYGVSNSQTNPCSDAQGAPYDPPFSVQFNLALSSGCNEDCDDGIDNDGDARLDCADDDCIADPVCNPPVGDDDDSSAETGDDDDSGTAHPGNDDDDSSTETGDDDDSGGTLGEPGDENSGSSCSCSASSRSRGAGAALLSLLVLMFRHLRRPRRYERGRIARCEVDHSW